VKAAVQPARESSAPSWTDERLVKECVRGNEEAWSALIDKYKNLIFSIPIKYEFSRDDASDIFQSVCVDLLSELPRLREPRALPKWLMQTTSHKCLHWKQRERRFVSGEDEEHAPEPACAARAEQVLAEAEQEQALRDAVSALSPRCGEMVRMLFFEMPARPYDEVARELGLATGSIGFIRGRCLEQLKKQLLARGFK
jgi:RNA polymerase sigma factor (sigma-70 family)